MYGLDLCLEPPLLTIPFPKVPLPQRFVKDPFSRISGFGGKVYLFCKSCASKPEILMLWEMPGLAAVFSDESVSGPIMPSVPTVLGYVEPICQDSGHVETAIAIRTKSTAFEHAISFESRKTHHLEEKDQLQLLAQKWEALISIDYHAFDRGLDLEQLPYAERVQVVLEVLGGKSLATIRQRCHN